MSRIIACQQMFRHHRPIQEADMSRLTIAGKNGAYTQLVSDYGEDPDMLHIGVSVQVDHRAGETLGSSMLLTGKIRVANINTKDFWPRAPLTGTVVFEEDDIMASMFIGKNGILESEWTADIPWRIRLKEQDGWTVTLLRLQHAERGYGDLLFKITAQPTKSDTVKLILGAIPFSAEQLNQDSDKDHRGFPLILLSEVRAKLFPQELAHHKWGMAIQPLLRMEGLQADEHGILDTSDVVWPTSMEVKKAAVSLLRSGFKTNYCKNAVIWNVRLGERPFPIRDSTIRWPEVLEEDDQETAGESAAGESMHYMVVGQQLLHN